MLCTKKAIAWSTQNKTSADSIGVQFIEQPRALVDANNKPTKGQRSYTTHNLTSRYPAILTQSLPLNWVPELAVLDGMFLIHVKPFRTKATFQDYKLLLQRFVQPHFKKGTKEVHVLFDKPTESGFNPKQWDQLGRDEDQVKENNTHTCTYNISDATKVPSNWK